MSVSEPRTADADPPEDAEKAPGADDATRTLAEAGGDVARAATDSATNDGWPSLDTLRTRTGPPDDRDRSGSPGRRGPAGSSDDRGRPGSPDDRGGTGSRDDRGRPGPPGRRGRTGATGDAGEAAASGEPVADSDRDDRRSGGPAASETPSRSRTSSGRGRTSARGGPSGATTAARAGAGGRGAAGGRRDRDGSVFVASAVTAGWAALVSFVPLLAMVVVAWLADGGSTAGTVTTLRFAGAAWLLGHGVPVGTAIGPVGLAPLALTALIVWRLVRAGRHTARAVGGDRRAALAGALGIAVGYGILAAIVALVVSTDDLTVAPVRACAVTGLVALLSAVAGTVYETGMAGHITRRLPPAARGGLRAGLCAALALLALGALAAGAAIAAHGNEAADTLRAYRAGAVGDIGMTVLCLAYAPNVAVWAVAYLAGPGFAVGTGTGVGIAGVHLGPVPAVPVLAGLPADALPAAGTLLLALPLLVGAAAGVLLARWVPGPLSRLAVAGAVAGGLCGVLLGVAGLLSAGSLGGGRMAEVGPSWWQLGLSTTGLVGAAAILVALAARLVRRRTTR